MKLPIVKFSLTVLSAALLAACGGGGEGGGNSAPASTSINSPSNSASNSGSSSIHQPSETKIEELERQAEEVATQKNPSVPSTTPVIEIPKNKETNQSKDSKSQSSGSSQSSQTNNQPSNSGNQQGNNAGKDQEAGANQDQTSGNTGTGAKDSTQGSSSTSESNSQTSPASNSQPNLDPNSGLTRPEYANSGDFLPALASTSVIYAPESGNIAHGQESAVEHTITSTNLASNVNSASAGNNSNSEAGIIAKNSSLQELNTTATKVSNNVKLDRGFMVIPSEAASDALKPEADLAYQRSQFLNYQYAPTTKKWYRTYKVFSSRTTNEYGYGYNRKRVLKYNDTILTLMGMYPVLINDSSFTKKLSLVSTTSDAQLVTNTSGSRSSGISGFVPLSQVLKVKDARDESANWLVSKDNDKRWSPVNGNGVAVGVIDGRYYPGYQSNFGKAPIVVEFEQTGKDNSMHSLHVASIIAHDNKQQGNTYGIAPASQIYQLQMYSGNFTKALQKLKEANSDIRVVNISMGHPVWFSGNSSYVGFNFNDYRRWVKNSVVDESANMAKLRKAGFDPLVVRSVGNNSALDYFVSHLPEGNFKSIYYGLYQYDETFEQRYLADPELSRSWLFVTGYHYDESDKYPYDARAFIEFLKTNRLYKIHDNTPEWSSFLSQYRNKSKAHGFVDLPKDHIYPDLLSVRCGSAMYSCLAASFYYQDHFLYGQGASHVNAALFNGTSAAAPQVSAIAALVAQNFPWMRGPELKTTLLTTATDIGAPGVDKVFGWGMVNAQRALLGPAQFFFEDFNADMSRAKTGAKYFFSNSISGKYGLKVNGKNDDWLFLAGVENTYQGPTLVESGNLVVIPGKHLGIDNDPTQQQGYAEYKNKYSEKLNGSFTSSTKDTQPNREGNKLFSKNDGDRNRASKVLNPALEYLSSSRTKLTSHVFVNKPEAGKASSFYAYDVELSNLVNNSYSELKQVTLDNLRNQEGAVLGLHLPNTAIANNSTTNLGTGNGINLNDSDYSKTQVKVKQILDLGPESVAKVYVGNESGSTDTSFRNNKTYVLIAAGELHGGFSKAYTDLPLYQVTLVNDNTNNQILAKLSTPNNAVRRLFSLRSAGTSLATAENGKNGDATAVNAVRTSSTETGKNATGTSIEVKQNSTSVVPEVSSIFAEAQSFSADAKVELAGASYLDQILNRAIELSSADQNPTSSSYPQGLQLASLASAPVLANGSDKEILTTAGLIASLKAEQLQVLSYNLAGTTYSNLQLASLNQSRKLQQNFNKAVGNFAGAVGANPGEIHAYVSYDRSQHNWSQAQSAIKGKLNSNSLTLGAYQQLELESPVFASYRHLNWGISASKSDTHWHETLNYLKSTPATSNQKLELGNGTGKNLGVNLAVGLADKANQHLVNLSIDQYRYNLELSTFNNNQKTAEFSGWSTTLGYNFAHRFELGEVVGLVVDAGAFTRYYHQASFSERTKSATASTSTTTTTADSSFNQGLLNFQAKARSSWQFGGEVGAQMSYTSQFSKELAVDWFAGARVQLTNGNNLKLTLTNPVSPDQSLETATGFPQNFTAELQLGATVRLNSNFSIKLVGNYEKASNYEQKGATATLDYSF